MGVGARQAGKSGRERPQLPSFASSTLFFKSSMVMDTLDLHFEFLLAAVLENNF